MINFTQTLEVACTPAFAFDRLADMTELDQWNPNVTRSRRIDGEPLVAVELGRLVRYEGAISIFWSVDELRFDESEQGCRITFSNESRGPAWLRPFGPLLDMAFQPQARKAVRGAQRYLNDC